MANFPTPEALKEESINDIETKVKEKLTLLRAHIKIGFSKGKYFDNYSVSVNGCRPEVSKRMIEILQDNGWFAQKNQVDEIVVRWREVVAQIKT